MIYLLPTNTCFGIACPLDDTKSYHRIYEIKKRDFKKPLSLMVESYEWLAKYTSLNDDQIEHLKNYPKPYTVLTDSPHISLILEFDQPDFEYKNKEVYKKIAFRVAHNEIHKKLIEEVGPIFLTSANFSWEKEIYDINEAKKQFSNYKEIIYLWEDIILDSSIKPSDIFEFDGDSTNIIYLRK